MNSEPLTYSVSELAELTRTSLGFIRSQIRAGKLEASKCGRRVLIPAASVQAWLRAGMQADPRKGKTENREIFG